ncbi:tyrosine-type recombinase/integrase [Natronoarchaeum rubrum]|uniref:tyrosine-type recombinase/integrase n=1 Tax=Natronoarchaeum rubrum TaxID=755311 RepID=UPI002111B61B|nr:site-specific integrase [Natronoarchaeum rubrum]
MTEQTESDRQRQQLADAFDQPIDPLADAQAVFDALDVDPFELFLTDVLDARDLAPSTRHHFEMIIDEWERFMARRERHPACPNAEHVEAYVHWQLDDEADGGKGNVPRTAKEKLRKLNQIYTFWQRDPAFPHPTDYNPIALARERVPLTVTKEKEHRRIAVDELREMVASVDDLRALVIILLQLKLGLRAGELANVKLEDLRMDDEDVAQYYPELGTHPRLAAYENAAYIPPGQEREGNKSRRPRVLPLDAELRDILNHYLFCRPDNGEPWLVLSKKSHTKMTNKTANSVWKDAFHPEYAETDEHRAVTSHFGRHRFTTYWRVEQDVNRQLVKYMRGDRTGAYQQDRGMNAYLHAYYEDIEELYRERIYKLC